MKIQSLNGLWSRKIGEGEPFEQVVPYSATPVGKSTCVRKFFTESFKRLFLKLDGITYRAWVSLNGRFLGEMLPYCEYEFEITDFVTVGENTLSVELEDINLSFGPTPGWENYGGIIRDVSLVYREDNYVTDVFFKSELTNSYKDATISVEVKSDKATDEDFEIGLFDADGKSVLSYSQKSGETKAQFLADVKLWSPDAPYLYTLSVKLGDYDTYLEKVAFREIKCDRHRFLLNGKPLFLKGVCKHEMIGESGHTVLPEQIEEDLKMIKSTGCNFVRLVHYPHCKATLEIADRLGLMVSEEPGLWWSDTSDEEVANGSLEVLKRTILRDKNHPSIVFWLCFNECKFTEQFLIDSASVCRKYDPTRLVSGANCMSDEDTLVYFNKCGFDFYTMHPYSASFDRAEKSAKILHDKPLLFTEWGGYFVFDNPAYMRESIQKMSALYHANSDEGALAGAFLWCWADVNDFNRGMPCIDGVLPEGLVTKNRKKHICYDTFCEEIAKIDTPPKEPPYSFKVLESVGGEPCALISSGGDFDVLVSEVENEERALPFRAKQRRRVIKNPPVLKREEIKGMSLIPAVLGDNDTLVYSGNGNARKITVLGAVSVNKGYPISGKFGEEAAMVTVKYEEGEQSFVIRNGRELTTVFSTIGSSRIDPRADNAPRFAELSYDLNFEQYVINKLEFKLDSAKPVKSIEISSLNKGYGILVYGVFLSR